MVQLELLKSITSRSDLAYLLGYKPNTLSYILYQIPDDKKYKKFDIPKKNGEVRKINAPTKKLKKLQKQLANLLYECFDEICNTNKTQKSLSHGFRRNHSIITNAKKHKNKRYVFNIDLQDFFPSINFGRVRGFFIKNQHFRLNDNVATAIAQIACYDNELPQGSPCSPIISNLIGHLLDVRMVNLAKKTKTTYSRYADDLTFSTNKKDFPEKIALRKKDSDWVVGKSLRKEIEKVGFLLNDKKTSMQYKTSRQMTTGLIVNKKINIRKEYYKKARSMCYELFKTDAFYIDTIDTLPELSGDEIDSDNKVMGTLNQLEGILSFIYQIKRLHDKNKFGSRRYNPNAITKLYRQLLFYKHFFSNGRPLIICEGKTDIIYLKCALKQLLSSYGDLVQKSDDKFEYKIAFLNISRNLRDVFAISKGTSGLASLIEMYIQNMEIFKGQGKKHPIIMIIDNDSGSIEIKKKIKEKLNIENFNHAHYNYYENLYIMFATDTEDKEIENIFDEDTLNTKIGGKVFSLEKTDNEKEYGKFVFAEKVIKAKQKEINFDGFKPIFDKVMSIINDYKLINV